MEQHGGTEWERLDTEELTERETALLQQIQAELKQLAFNPSEELEAQLNQKLSDLKTIREQLATQARVVEEDEFFIQMESNDLTD